MSELREKRHTCPLCNGEGMLPEGKVPVDIMPDHQRRESIPGMTEIRPGVWTAPSRSIFVKQDK